MRLISALRSRAPRPSAVRARRRLGLAVCCGLFIAFVAYHYLFNVLDVPARVFPELGGKDFGARTALARLHIDLWITDKAGRVVDLFTADNPRVKVAPGVASLALDGTVYAAPPRRGRRVLRNRLREALASPPSCPQRPGRNLTQRPFLIVSQPNWGVACPTDDIHPAPGWYDYTKDAILPCDVPCVHTANRAHLHDADLAVTWNPGAAYDDALRLWGGRVRAACPLQRRALLSLESERRFSELRMTKWRLAFWDFMGSPALDSDVPMMYSPWEKRCFGHFHAPYPRQGGLTPPPVLPKPPGAMAVAFISNCYDVHTDRVAYIHRMMAAGLTVDLFGQCVGDGKVLEAPPPGSSIDTYGLTVTPPLYDSKLKTLGRYRFTLAFENSRVPYYATEKFYQPLFAGSLPVVYGAPNVADVAPGPRSFISADDWPSPEALARHLVSLVRNDTAYMEHFDWHAPGPSAQFERAEAAALEIHPYCRLCRTVARMHQVELNEVPPSPPPPPDPRLTLEPWWVAGSGLKYDVHNWKTGLQNPPPPPPKEEELPDVNNNRLKSHA